MHDQCQDDDQDQVEEFGLIGHKSPPFKTALAQLAAKMRWRKARAKGHASAIVLVIQSL
jgi:hypothetical protein